jgi:hypothetical protein
MLNSSKKLMCIFSLLLFSGLVPGQRTNPAEESALTPDQVEYRRQQDQRSRENRQAADLRQLEQNRNASIVFPTTKRDKPYTREETAKIKALLEPNREDSARYKDFLRQSKTGLFRLFPFLDCEGANLIRVDAECADYISGSWSYSFRARNYSDATFFDLKFREDNLISGSALSLGILTALGDVQLENVSLASDGMKFLAELKPETGQPESEKQIGGFVKGVESGGYKYSNKIKIGENMTYGLRVVAYRMPESVKLVFDSGDKPVAGNGFYSFPLNQSDERDDVVIAFRIVRKEAGNITILWKELKRAAAPKLVFPKDVKKATVKSKSD